MTVLLGSPDKAQALAQANMAGGGELDKGRATSPLPPALVSIDGDDREPDQQRHQQGHRDGDGEGLRQQGHHHVQHRDGGHALRNQFLGEFDEKGHQKNEGEHQQGDGKRRDHAPDEIAVNQSQHQMFCLNDTTLNRGRAVASQRTVGLAAPT